MPDANELEMTNWLKRNSTRNRTNRFRQYDDIVKVIPNLTDEKNGLKRDDNSIEDEKMQDKYEEKEVDNVTGQQYQQMVDQVAELFMFRQQINPQDQDLLLKAALGVGNEANNRSVIKNWVFDQLVTVDMTMPKREIVNYLVDQFDELIFELSE